MSTQPPHHPMDRNRPASIDEAKKQELQRRVVEGNRVKDLLSNLILGERAQTGGEGSHVLAVPGGWIFYDTHKAGITSTFVPVPPQTPTFTEKMVMP